MRPWIVLAGSAPLLAIGLWFLVAPPKAKTALTLIAPPGLKKIEHFIFIMQENRSFDAYFGKYPNAEGRPDGVCLPDPIGGSCVALLHDANVVNRGGPHRWKSAQPDINQAKMDEFLAQSYSNSMPDRRCTPPALNCSPGTDPRDVMGWHDQREISNYWNYAKLYVLQDVLQDRLFESVASYSLPSE